MKTETQVYISDSLAAAGKTLIRFCSQESSDVTVPSRENKLRLSELGAASVVADKAPSITIAEGYTRLRGRCIKSDKARRLVLPASLEAAESPLMTSGRLLPIIELKRSLPDGVRRELIRQSVPVGGERRMLNPEIIDVPGLAPLPEVIRSVQGLPLPQQPPETRFLFFREGEDKKSLFDSRGCLDFHGQSAETEEYDAVMRMIREGATGWRDAGAEELNDRLIHNEGPDPWSHRYSFHRLCILLTDASCLQIIGTYMFAPALYPVRWNGKDWFLYSRLHLTSKPDIPYLREDVCIFSRNGMVTDGKLSDRIYLKIRLIASL